MIGGPVDKIEASGKIGLDLHVCCPGLADVGHLQVKVDRIIALDRGRSRQAQCSAGRARRVRTRWPCSNWTRAQVSMSLVPFGLRTTRIFLRA